MAKIYADLLLSRGFKDENELNEFLKNCNDESWIKELQEYYGLVNKEEIKEDADITKSDELQINKKSKNKVKEEL